MLTDWTPPLTTIFVKLLVLVLAILPIIFPPTYKSLPIAAPPTTVIAPPVLTLVAFVEVVTNKDNTVVVLKVDGFELINHADPFHW